MKKLIGIVGIGILAAAVITGGYFVLNKKFKKPVNLPAQIKVRLPTGEVVTAYRITAGAQQRPPSGARVIISGKIGKETDDIGATQLVLESETKIKYILINAPYVLKLEKDALRKKVKIKGITISKTTFKDYPAIYIEDIIEIY